MFFMSRFIYYKGSRFTLKNNVCVLVKVLRVMWLLCYRKVHIDQNFILKIKSLERSG